MASHMESTVTLLTRSLRKIRETRPLEYLAAFKNRILSHSQFGEDVHLASFLKGLAFARGTIVRPGWIVDVGAFRPITLSNTYHFYKCGWRCINIDATPGTKQLFDRVRPKDINLQVGIGSERGTAELYVFGRPSVWNTMDKEAAEQAQLKLDICPEVVEIDVLRLEDVLNEHLGNSPLEMLLIDAEGFDLEILESHDFGKWPPRLILIEVNGIGADTLTIHPVYQYLIERGYRLHSWIYPNLLFARADSAWGG
jgi:FkbM family methyltransferase